MAMKAEELPHVPTDSFGVRLAIIRAAAGGLNITAAATKFGLDAENWRRWEKGQLPRDQGAVARQLARATGFDYVWIMAGGPLRAEGVIDRSLANPLLTAVVLGNDQLEFAFPENRTPAPLRVVSDRHSVIWNHADVMSLTG